jgi:integrase
MVSRKKNLWKMKPSLHRPDDIELRRSEKRKLPRAIEELLVDIDSYTDKDYDEKAKIFIGYCKIRNLSHPTTLRYFRLARMRGIFGDTCSIVPSRKEFGGSGRSQIRVVTRKLFIRLIAYLTERWSRFTAPILLSLFTGLRNMEVLQFSTVTLEELSENRSETISSIRRKCAATIFDDESDVGHCGDRAIFWRPIYHARFDRFIVKLRDLYTEEYALYKRFGLSIRLFPFSMSTLSNRMRVCFFRATGRAPPLGLGLHSMRTMVSTFLAQDTKNIRLIQRFLQHKNIRSTFRYVKMDLDTLRVQLDDTVKDEFKKIEETIRQIE